MRPRVTHEMTEKCNDKVILKTLRLNIIVLPRLKEAMDVI